VEEGEAKKGEKGRDRFLKEDGESAGGGTCGSGEKRATRGGGRRWKSSGIEQTDSKNKLVTFFCSGDWRGGGGKAQKKSRCSKRSRRGDAGRFESGVSAERRERSACEARAGV